MLGREPGSHAGITQMVFITGRNKRAIEDHFDKAYELETELESHGKLALLKQAQNILPKHVSCIYVRQPGWGLHLVRLAAGCAAVASTRA